MKFTRSRNIAIWQRSNLRRKLFTSPSTYFSLLSWAGYVQPYRNMLKTRQLTTINNFSGFMITALKLSNIWLDWAYTIQLAQHYFNLSWKLGRSNYSLFIFTRSHRPCFRPLRDLRSAKVLTKPLVRNLSKYL